jgi:hypothetical protein
MHSKRRWQDETNRTRSPLPNLALVQIKGWRKRQPSSRVLAPLQTAPPQNSTVDLKLISMTCTTSERIDL